MRKEDTRIGSVMRLGEARPMNQRGQEEHNIYMVRTGSGVRFHCLSSQSISSIHKTAHT